MTSIMAFVCADVIVILNNLKFNSYLIADILDNYEQITRSYYCPYLCFNALYRPSIHPSNYKHSPEHKPTVPAQIQIPNILPAKA